MSPIAARNDAAQITSNATRSDGRRLSANTASASGVDATRPAERSFPSSQIAISQKSRCKFNPIAPRHRPFRPGPTVARPGRRRPRQKPIR
jgi:hypothetical protein